MKPQLEIIKEKIVFRDRIAFLVNIWRLKSQKVVFTNGCFDLIHQGHIDYLSKAADLGDKLIIGLNTDVSVRMLGKDKNRPIQDQNSRAIILAALAFTDAVVLFNESTPLELIKMVKPDVLVKGSDYTISEIVGSSEVIENGGKVETIDFLDGYSTSSIVRKIKE